MIRTALHLLWIVWRLVVIVAMVCLMAYIKLVIG